MAHEQHGMTHRIHTCMHCHTKANLGRSASTKRALRLEAPKFNKNKGKRKTAAQLAAQKATANLPPADAGIFGHTTGELVDRLKGLNQCVFNYSGAGVAMFKGKRFKPGDDIPTDRNIMLLRSDREASLIKLFFHLLYHEGIDGFWESDELHDDWNLVFNSVSDAGMSSPSPS